MKSLSIKEYPKTCVEHFCALAQKYPQLAFSGTPNSWTHFWRHNKQVLIRTGAAILPVNRTPIAHNERFEPVVIALIAGTPLPRFGERPSEKRREG